MSLSVTILLKVNIVDLIGLLYLQEVFHVYLNKFKIEVSHLFLIIFSYNKFTPVNLISMNTQTPRK